MQTLCILPQSLSSVYSEGLCPPSHFSESWWERFDGDSLFRVTWVFLNLKLWRLASKVSNTALSFHSDQASSCLLLALYYTHLCVLQIFILSQKFPYTSTFTQQPDRSTRWKERADSQEVVLWPPHKGCDMPCMHTEINKWNFQLKKHALN